MFNVRLLFKLPRVVPQQKDKFEEEDIFKKHSRDTEVKYTLYRDRPAHERQAKFQSACRDGHTELVSIIILYLVSDVLPQTEIVDSLQRFRRGIFPNATTVSQSDLS